MDTQKHTLRYVREGTHNSAFFIINLINQHDSIDRFPYNTKDYLSEVYKPREPVSDL